MDNMIFKRTSVRKYTGEKLSQEQIDMLLKAGMAAPSACNAQPWELVVIQNADTLEKITTLHNHAFMLPKAGFGIIVCSDETKVPAAVPDVTFWPQDCAAVTQNIMLQAAEMGLGSVWMGVYPIEPVMNSISELLALPDNVKPFSIIAVGYPDGEIKAKDKFDKAKIHYEQW